ncbi:uncharacterized protein LOC117178332 isoform X2 [Belonocnema kinseyi]|uniref:uncharacterized protein LOC117178332 isoform X2 n=1 Tax=Belonocnema kinseyi TaxID=2817044 RepID=UPI00143DA819|nr:uncharacterized protein LOC117178332 isoform X2 [Belonocnema kinseyi]
MKRCLPDTNCSESSDVSPSKKLCPSNVFESDPAKDVASNLESNEARKNMKRHMPYIDVSDIPPTKQFRFYDGP